MKDKKNNKKAVSPLIGYIILVVIVVAMVPIVYTFLKSWTPTSDSLKCPDEVSIFVTETNITEDILTIKVKNNGRFNLHGYYFYASNKSDKEEGTIDLSDEDYFKNTEGESLKVFEGTSIVTSNAGGENPFKTGQEIAFQFNISEIKPVYLVDITPVRYQKHEGKRRKATCGNAKITKEIN